MFKDILQFVIFLFPFIKKMSNRSTVTGAVLFKIGGLSMISERKNGYKNGHNMFYGGLRKDLTPVYNF